MAFNDRQLELGGDPFVGAKLGNLLQAVGFRDIRTEVKTFHLDNRVPGERAEFLALLDRPAALGRARAARAEARLRRGREGDEARARPRRPRPEQRVLLLVHPGAGDGVEVAPVFDAIGLELAETYEVTECELSNNSHGARGVGESTERSASNHFRCERACALAARR